MTKVNDEDRQRPAGRPFRHPDPDAVVARRRLLVRVRNKAYSILAQRHPEEYLSIKNDLLTRNGHPPIESAYATKQALASMDDPL